MNKSESAVALAVEQGRVTTWADGFGIWHARVPLSMAFPMGVAKLAIRLEHKARAPRGREDEVPMPHVRVVSRDEDNNTVEFMEDTTRDQ